MAAAVLGVRILLGVLLFVAGAMKVGHPAQLAESIAGFRLLPAAIVGPLALALPYFELLVGLYLVVGLFTRLAAVIAAAQFIAYAGVIASALMRHIAANCGCFGPSDSSPPDWPHVALDIALAGASIFIVWRAPGALAVDRMLRSA